MSVKANDLSIGQCISLNNKIWRLIDKMHVKPGKGGAFIQAKLKSIDGTKLEHRFQSNDSVDIVIIEKNTCKFSYKEKDCLFFTDNATYEIIEVQKSILPKYTMQLLDDFADENLDLEIEYASLEGGEPNIIDILLPNNVKVVVTSADPVVKGQTASSSFKNAEIKNHIKIIVPPYVNANDQIIINPYGETGIEFVKRT